MLYRPSNFKKSSRAVTAIAAAGLFVSASLMGTGPVSAEPATKDFAAACATVTDANAHAGCLVDAMNKHAAQMKKEAATSRQESAAARKESADAKTATSCMGLVGKDIETAKARGPLTPDMKASFKARIEKCDRVSSL